MGNRRVYMFKCQFEIIILTLTPQCVVNNICLCSIIFL